MIAYKCKLKCRFIYASYVYGYVKVYFSVKMLLMFWNIYIYHSEYIQKCTWVKYTINLMLLGIEKENPHRDISYNHIKYFILHAYLHTCL